MTHLDTIAASYQSVINQMVERLKEILKETQTPIDGLTAQEIICSDDCSIWEPFISLARNYSSCLQGFDVIPSEVERECVESAIAQHRKQRELSYLLDKLSDELIELQHVDITFATEAAVKKLIDLWIQVIRDGRENHDFRLDTEVTVKEIETWSSKADPVLKKYSNRIARLNEQLG